MALVRSNLGRPKVRKVEIDEGISTGGGHAAGKNYSVERRLNL